jgi:hypothetical protein
MNTKFGTKPRAGRPTIGDRPMTATERSARRRARARAQGPKAVKPFTSSDEIYAALVEQRNLTSAFDRALAMEVVDALVRGDLAEAVRALALLPTPAVRVETSRTVSASDAKERLLELVLNAIAADQFEADQADQGDLQAARARIASLEDEVKHLRGVKPRRLPAPSEKPVARKSDADTTAANFQVTGKSKSAAAKPAADPAPAASAPSPPSPPSQSWDASPGGQAWHQWRAAGGYGGGDAPAQGWIDRLNAKSW